MIGRVHFFGLVVDLCDLRAVRRVARDLVDGEVALGQGADGQGEGYRIPRLDVVIMNAGIGGWKGLNWPKAVWTVLTDIVHATTWPEYKLADVGKRAKLQSVFGKEQRQTLRDGDGDAVDGNERDVDEPVLGEVFTANVFGHYMLGHWLMPLLHRPPRPLEGPPHLDQANPSLAMSEPSTSSNSKINTPTSSQSNSPPHTPDQITSGEDRLSRESSRGRVIWISSIEAVDSVFSIDDIQGLQSAEPYESSKRLTDILALTADLPGVRKYSQSYFEISNKSGSTNPEYEEPKSPRTYLAHPGICGTDIVPLPWILVQAMTLSFYLARWLGSVWHCITPYNGACSIVWLALMGDSVLGSFEGGEEGKSKWGSSTDWGGNVRVKRTEVDGWGWCGTTENVNGEKRTGRRRGAKDLTEEDRIEFEALGGRVWREMECMRKEWEERLGEE